MSQGEKKAVFGEFTYIKNLPKNELTIFQVCLLICVDVTSLNNQMLFKNAHNFFQQ